MVISKIIFYNDLQKFIINITYGIKNLSQIENCSFPLHLLTKAFEHSARLLIYFQNIVTSLHEISLSEKQWSKEIWIIWFKELQFEPIRFKVYHNSLAFFVKFQNLDYIIIFFFNLNNFVLVKMSVHS